MNIMTEAEKVAETFAQIERGDKPVRTAQLLAAAEHLAQKSSDRETALLLLGILRHVIVSNTRIRQEMAPMQEVASRYALCR